VAAGARHRAASHCHSFASRWISSFLGKQKFVLLNLAHDRRRILHFNVTSSPSAEWTAQQVVQSFPDDSATRYLLRDRDCIYGKYFRRRVKNLGIKEVLTAARSPWQNPYVERLIGSI
jgi:hypothetical protein